jgi:hypothetical protein
MFSSWLELPGGSDLRWHLSRSGRTGRTCGRMRLLVVGKTAARRLGSAAD